jgi:hypothetical protein
LAVDYLQQPDECHGDKKGKKRGEKNNNKNKNRSKKKKRGAREDH